MINVILHDDGQILDRYKEFFTQAAATQRSDLFFNNVDDPEERIIEEVSSDPEISVIIQVGGQLVMDLFQSCLPPCKQIRQVLVINAPPFADEERALANQWEKVNRTEERLKITRKNSF